jgi:hypothetical protein
VYVKVLGTSRAADVNVLLAVWTFNYAFIGILASSPVGLQSLLVSEFRGHLNFALLSLPSCGTTGSSSGSQPKVYTQPPGICWRVRT